MITKKGNIIGIFLIGLLITGLWFFTIITFVAHIGKQVDERGGLKAIAERIWNGKGQTDGTK